MKNTSRRDLKTSRSCRSCTKKYVFSTHGGDTSNPNQSQMARARQAAHGIEVLEACAESSKESSGTPEEREKERGKERERTSCVYVTHRHGIKDDCVDSCYIHLVSFHF